MKCDRLIDGENREKENSRSGLGGRNTIMGAFVTAAARDLMYKRYRSKLKPNQLLYTDTDSVVVYRNKKNLSHIELSTSDMLGELKDEYEGVLASNANWLINEFIAFGPKMYQLTFKDKVTSQIVKWDKTMKGISVKGNANFFLSRNLHLYRNPVLDFCSILHMVRMIDFQI